MAHPASGPPALRRLGLGVGATAAEVNLRLAFDGAASLGAVWSVGSGDLALRERRCRWVAVSGRKTIDEIFHALVQLFLHPRVRLPEYLFERRHARRNAERWRYEHSNWKMNPEKGLTGSADA
jgi:hypothetical protein